MIHVKGSGDASHISSLMFEEANVKVGDDLEKTADRCQHVDDVFGETVAEVLAAGDRS